jgi:MFS family permease
VKILNNSNRISGNDLKKSLMFVTLAASFGLPFFSVINGPALTGFTRALGANDFVYSVIMALPVIGAIIQVFFSYVMINSGKRRLLFIAAGYVHRPLWFVIAFIPFLLNPDKTKAGIVVITLLIAISSIANSIVGLAFSSWMGDLVPVEVKGRFFGRRAMIYTITGGTAALLCGLLLDNIHGYSGYAVVFVFAAILGTADITMFFWVKHPPMAAHKERQPFFMLFFEPFKDRNYFRYVLFVAFWYFSVNIAGPFFNVYMIEELKMSFLLISLFTQVAANVSTIFFIRIWGNLADKYGSRPVMSLCCASIIVLPVIWLFTTPHSIWVVLAINLMTGIFWPGFEMTALNQSIWLAPEKNRSSYLANYTLVVMLIGTAAAYLCGGAFMQLTRASIPAGGIPLFAGIKLGSFHLLFLISAFARLLVLVFIFRGYEEKGSSHSIQILRDLKSSLYGIINMQK